MAAPWDNTTSMPSWDDILDVREENERQGGQVVYAVHTGRPIEYLLPSKRPRLNKVSHKPWNEETCGCDEEALVAVRVSKNGPLETLCVICDALHLTPRFGGDILDPPEPPPMMGMF